MSDTAIAESSARPHSKYLNLAALSAMAHLRFATRHRIEQGSAKLPYAPIYGYLPAVLTSGSKGES